MSSRNPPTPAVSPASPSFCVRLMDALFALSSSSPTNRNRTISDRHPMAAYFVIKPPEKKKRKTAAVDSVDAEANDNITVEWILLATHILQQLVMEDYISDSNLDNAITMAWLSHAMSMAFSPVTTSSSTNSKFAKHLLGHWRLVVVHAATLSLSLIAANGPQDGLESNYSQEDKDMALCAAFAAVDTATTSDHTTSTFNPVELKRYWEQHARDHLSRTTAPSTSSSSLDWSREDQCINALVSPPMAPATSSRRTRRQAPEASASPQELLRSLLSSSANGTSTDLTLIDSRLPLKRWAPVAWTWYLNGPELLMQSLLQRLEQANSPPSKTFRQFLSYVPSLLALTDAGTRAPSSSGTSYDTAVSALSHRVNERLGREATTAATSNLAPRIVAFFYHFLRVHYESVAALDSISILSVLSSDWSTAISVRDMEYYIVSFILSLQRQHRIVDVALTTYVITLLRTGMERHSATPNAEPFTWPPSLPTDAVAAAAWDPWIALPPSEAASWGFLLLELLEFVCGTTPPPSTKKRGRPAPVRIWESPHYPHHFLAEPICATLRAWLDQRGLRLPSSMVNRLLQVGLLVEDGWSSHPPNTTLSWSTHMDLYMVLGRRSESTRLEAYQSIAAAAGSWPICLRPSQRAFVTATLALPADAAADGFVVSAILAALTEKIPDAQPSDLTWLDDTDETSSELCWHVPLSLFDARIFLTAFSRLSLDDQTTHFIALLFVMERLMHRCQGNVADLTAVRCAGVARVITLVTTAYAVMKLGTPLRRKLTDILEASGRVFALGAGEKENSYDVNCNYMGVFENWDSPALPPISFLPMRSAEVKTFPLLERVLEQAVQLGFATAKLDSCHILYAAWNACGKRDLWSNSDSSRNFIQPFEFLSSGSMNILQLRDEMCMVHRLVKKWHGESLRETALVRVVEDSISRPKSAQQIVTLLRAMIQKASRLVDFLMYKTISLTDDADMSDGGMTPECFCLLEQCAVYISFAVSMMTRPSTDFFTATLSQMKQQDQSRGYSIDSDVAESSDEVTQLSSEAGIALTLDRIQEVCICLGAAPAHPDWLDRGCRLLEHLAPSEAVKVATEAQVCLTKLVSAGLLESQRQIRQAFRKSPCRRNVPSFNSVDIATKLCWLRMYRPSGSSTDANQYVVGRDFGSDVGDICGYDAAIVNAIVAETGIKQRRAVEYRFLPYCRQCIYGKVPDSVSVERWRDMWGPELRAFGEWELLLSATLSSACVDVRVAESIGELNDEVLESISLSERWFFVYFVAIGALLPTTALLRFGLFTTGRVPHPLSFAESVVGEFQSGKRYVLEEHRHDLESTEAVSESITSTLVALAHCPPFLPFRICHAVATHLVVDPGSFTTLQGMVACAHSLQVLDGVGIAAHFDDAVSVAPFMIQHIAEILNAFGNDGQFSESNDSYTIHRLCACIVGRDVSQEFCFNTISSRDVDPFSCLLQLHLGRFNEDLSWQWNNLHCSTVRLMVFYAMRNTLNVNESTRAFFAFVISQLLTYDLENTEDMLSNLKKDILPVLIEACNSISVDEIEGVLCIDVCGFPSRSNLSDEQVISTFPPVGDSLCTLFVFLLLAPRMGMTFLRVDNVFACLERLLGTVKKECSESVLNLAFSYASQKELLHTIGSRLFEELNATNWARSEGATEVRCVSFFVDFLQKFFSAFPRLKANAYVQPSSDGNNNVVSYLPICCSYVLDNDFHEQHWYHCFTCGLTNEKGCCTLCAALCHKGHDVAYSRHSAFFCDCGGEDESKGYSSQRRCKCLSPNARDNLLTTATRGDKGFPQQEKNVTYSSALSADLCAKILKNACIENCLASMEKIISCSDASSWIKVGLEFSECYFNRWRALSFTRLFDHDPESKSIKLSLKNLADTTEAMRLSCGSMLSSGFTMIGSFQSGLSKRTIVEKTLGESQVCDESVKMSTTHILDADSRGRIVVAELNRLVFFSGFNLLNSRSISSENTAYTKISKLLSKNVSFTSSIPVGFQTTGVQFARNRTNVVCVWGQNEAKVFFLNMSLSAVVFETSVLIAVTRDDELRRRVVQCHWLPGSNLLLAVGCSDHVSVYDVSKAENLLTPALTVTVTSTDSCIQDYVVVRMVHKDDNDCDMSWKIFSAVTNDRIQEVVIRQRLNEKLCAETTSFFTCYSIGDSLNIFPAISPRVFHLEQSNILLCSSGDSDVMAVFLNKNACANRCCRLIPFRISSELLRRNDNVDVTGPYRQWKESGNVLRGEEGFVRLSCIGQLETSSADVLLHLEFNSRCVNLSVMMPEPIVECCHLREYRGLTVFTAPYLVSESIPYSLQDNKEFKESIVLCALTRKGCFEVFVEDADAFSMPGSLPSCLTDVCGSRVYLEKNSRVISSLSQSLRIASIEGLENLSDSKDIAFGGYGLPSSELIREKLRSESESGLSSPRKESFTITISLLDQKRENDPLNNLCQCSIQETKSVDFVIAAVRIFVGAPLKSVPRFVKVLGQAYEFVVGVKRWYTFYLSAQEIAFAVRTGFISLEVGSCHDSSSLPTLNKVEIYGIEKGKIEPWLPVAVPSIWAHACDPSRASEVSSRELFCLGINTTATLAKTLGGLKPNPFVRESVQTFIAGTALNNDHILHDSLSVLLSCVETDEDRRQYLFDKSVLSGCSSFLSMCLRHIEKRNEVDSFVIWKIISLIPTFRACLRIAAVIAKLRPLHYLQISDGSIASDVSPVMVDCLTHSLSLDLVSDFVELSLLESAVTNSSPRGGLGSLDGIRSLLLSHNEQIVVKTCISISRFCRESHMFKSQTMAVRYVCDRCLVFINDVRYTTLEKEPTFDLCPSCYSIAKKYADNFERTENVIIEGRVVGESPRLTCGDVLAMEPIATSHQHDQISGDIEHQHQLFSDFMDGLTTGVSSVLCNKLKEKCDVSSALIWLTVDIIRHVSSSGRKMEQGKALLSALLLGLNRRLSLSNDDDRNVLNCALILEGLIKMIVVDETAREFCLFSDNGFVPTIANAELTNSVCTVHKAPLGHYKCCSGKDKERTFAACSNDADRKCSFFRWTDRVNETQRSANSAGSLFDENTATLVWKLLSSGHLYEGIPLLSRLSLFVETFSSQPFKHNVFPSNETTFVHDDCSDDIRNGYSDGVLCCHGRQRSELFLKDTIELFHRLKSSSGNPTLSTPSAICAMVEKLLELLSLVANVDVPDGDKWAASLCRLSISDKVALSSRIRSLARRTLWQFCGRDTALSHAVRDQYIFTFQFERLLRQTDDLLDYCVVLTEKSRVCGPQWKTTRCCSLHGMKVFQFVGAEALMTEDNCTLQANAAILEILRDVHASAEKRGGSWRRFCGLRKFPVDDSSTDLRSDFLAAPPLIILLALACTASIENQVLALRLINFALSPKSTNRKKSGNGSEENRINATIHRFTSHVAQSEAPEAILEVSIDDIYFLTTRFVWGGVSSDVQKAALGVATKLLHCLDKKSLGVLLDRFVAGPLCQIGGLGKRCIYFFSLLQSLVRFVNFEVVDVSRCSNTVLSFLKVQVLATRHDHANGEIFHVEEKSGTSKRIKHFDITACISCRSIAIRSITGKLESSRPVPTDARAASTSIRPPANANSSPKSSCHPEQVSPFSRIRLDMSREHACSSEFCSFVALKHRCIISTIHVDVENPRRFVKTIKFSFAPRPVEDLSVLKSNEFASCWQQCGELTLTRGSAKSSLALPIPVVAANLKIEYIDFHERSGSTKASDGTFVVLCPRCTRVVTNAHGVCSNCGEVAFQCRKCRHINYDRLDAFLCVECGYCASASFRYDITAAVATNAVAITNDHDLKKASYQLKFASHLYEELRAALKDKLRGVAASNEKFGAVDGNDESMKDFPVLCRAFQDILSEKVAIDESRCKTIKSLTSELGAPGAIVKLIATATNKDRSASSRFHALLDPSSMASGQTERRLPSGFLFRESDRDVLDDDDATAEAFNRSLDATSGSSVARYSDSVDPLMRLLSSGPSRRDRSGEESQRHQSEAPATATESSERNRPQKKAKHSACITVDRETLTICDRLYQLMREAESEMYELERRCAAWRYLNSGALFASPAVYANNNERIRHFEPSHCSSCASTLVVQLYLLWLRLFQLHPNDIVVPKEMIQLLFETDPADVIKQYSSSAFTLLLETKQTIVQEIALYSEQGSALVLDALRVRLTTWPDRNAADILGHILEAFAAPANPPVTSVGPFVELAHVALRGDNAS